VPTVLLRSRLYRVQRSISPRPPRKSRFLSNSVARLTHEWLKCCEGPFRRTLEPPKASSFDIGAPGFDIGVE